MSRCSLRRALQLDLLATDIECFQNLSLLVIANDALDHCFRVTTKVGEQTEAQASGL
jgi:hypothetical protein